jgi:hypothetical protein
MTVKIQLFDKVGVALPSIIQVAERVPREAENGTSVG